MLISLGVCDMVPLEDHLYMAIIGDIKDSRLIKDRNDVQVKLKNILQAVNEKYETDIASKFIITLGDEFQGLLSAGKNVMPIIFEIERNMYPVKIRFGIGVGEISTAIDYEQAIGADGPVYYKAREAIERLKQDERKKQTADADIRVESVNANQSTIMLINAILLLMTAIKDSWSERQRQTIWVMMEYQGGQVDAAQRLGIKQSSVQKNLMSGKFYSYKEAMKTVKKTFETITEKKDV